jgi:hypothetical protein
VMTDSDGTRRATLLFPQGAQAEMVMPDGSTQPITTLRVRATEFTVGPNGPQAMPAALPPNSAYTYAVVFTADEAKAAGAKDVRFAQPLPFYVENFLGFPVGIEVPLGAYDPGKGVWVASDSGRVVNILSISGALADLDTDGDGVVDNGTALGVTDAERQQLASLYSVGQSLWRVLIPHFDQTWDANLGFSPPPDAQPSDGGGGGGGNDDKKDHCGTDDCDDSCRKPGSSDIACQNQLLSEALEVVGMPFKLHYASDRVPGYKAGRTLDIPLSGSSVPASLKRIDIQVTVGGRLLAAQSFSNAPNQRATVTWDGQDAYGRPLLGRQPATVRIGYVYGGVYQQVSRFGYNGNGIPITGSKMRQEVTNGAS